MHGGSEKNCEQALFQCCDQLLTQLKDIRVPIRFLSQFNEYKILELDISTRLPDYKVPKSPLHFGILMRYCPWCGAKLPESLFSVWESQLLELNTHDEDATNITNLDIIPDEYLDCRWWHNKQK